MEQASQELAEDETQEAFLRLFTEVQAGRIPDNVRAWLYRASANLVVSRARRAAVARRFAPSLVRFDGPAQPDALAVLSEEQEEVRLALDATAIGRATLRDLGIRSGDHIVVPRKRFTRDDVSFFLQVATFGLVVYTVFHR